MTPLFRRPADTCLPGQRHQFDRWQVSSETPIYRSSDMGVIGTAVLQVRECGACGYKQIDLQRGKL